MNTENMMLHLTEEAAKHRQPDHEINPLFLNRWSPRSFEEREVSEEVLLRVFEAARWAPSASNEQPWRFIVARTSEERQRFLPFIADGNREWCHKAPVLTLLVSKKTTGRGGTNRTAMFDSGTAWGYLALEAARQGLITHAMGGFDPEQAMQDLNIPDEYIPCCVIAIGYRGGLESLSDKQRAREVPSSRRPVKESLFAGSFGTPWE